ncbi:Tumor necrosis factor receptor superfamily member 1A [Labeo rohita]|uniref:Tumor necrosis factor receptor superfamily member 1A n=2 Tax=Labeo rohita TaxID=84645 RepID=A0ABQ8LXX5_LABRO|nr:Tumor necrosis factor receptor superfamily member 1A [Labeo rohita]
MFHIQGQHKRKLLPCVLLLLIVGVVAGNRSVSSKRDCSKNEYWRDRHCSDGGGLCCDKCAPGYKLTRKCCDGVPSQCERCSEGTYLDKMNYFPNCFRCEKCNKPNAIVISPCTPQNNTVCGCQSGYRKKFYDSITWECLPLKKFVSIL